MDNKEYLEKSKKIDDDRSKNLNEFPERVSEWEIEYRKTKALEIIAETLIDIRDFEMGSIVIYKDLVIDVHKLEKRIKKMEGKFNG